MTKQALILIVAVVMLLSTGAATGQEHDNAIQQLQDQATAAFESRDFSAARNALIKVRSAKPKNPAVRYNLACALAQLGDKEAATEELIQAISFGFIDFNHMLRDEHLTALRGEQLFDTIIASWRDLLDARADANFKAAQSLFGKRYTYERDPELRLLYVSAFDTRSFTEGRAEIGQIARWALDRLFTDLSLDDGSSQQPDPWVTVILPSPEDFVRMVRASNVGGFYDHDQRKLISQDIGPSFRHEFLHVLHWRDMTRRDQRHPEWIMEGLGTLVEDVDVDESGRLVAFAPSWRTNIVKRLARGNRLTHWRDLMTMERKRFVTHRPNAHYAEARAVMIFLHESKQLTEWYAAYVRGFETDPTGVNAIETVFNEELESIEQRFLAWVNDLPEVAEEIKPGMASLGVEVSPGRGDGPTVQLVLPRTGASKAGMRRRDVITALNGRSTRTMEDLVRFLSEYEPGERVEVTIRRGTRRLVLKVELIEAREE